MIMAIEKCKIGIGGPNGRSPLEISRRTEVTLKPFGEDIFVDGMAPCDRLSLSRTLSPRPHPCPTRRNSSSL